MPIPVEIIGKNRTDVTFVWDDDGDPSSTRTVSARKLRQGCRCAHCVEEMTGRQLLDKEKVPHDLRVTDLELVGNYGVRITFSDKHATGIYRFRDLFDLCTPSGSQQAK